MKYLKAIEIILGVLVAFLFIVFLVLEVDDFIQREKSIYGQSRKHIWANEDVEPNVFFEVKSMDKNSYEGIFYTREDTVWVSGLQKGSTHYPSGASIANDDKEESFVDHFFLRSKGNKSDTLTFGRIDSLLGHSNLELYKMKKPTVK